MKPIFSLAVIAALAVPSIVDAEWRFAWRVDGQDYSCSVSSDSRRVRTGSGRQETTVQLDLEEDGSIALRSDPVPFNRDALDAGGLSTDDQLPIIHPVKLSRDGRTLTFSADISAALHRQFEEGSSITAVMAFVHGVKVKQQFPLDGYRDAVAQYKGCWGLLYSPGWMGFFTKEAEQVPERISLIKKNAPYRKEGLIIVTVDPRKEAYKNDLRPGDRITSCNGREVDVKDLVRVIKELAPGESLELGMVRDGKPFTKTIRRPQ